MANKQKQLTPFEQAEVNRKEGMKRIAGILVTTAWIQRVKLLKLGLGKLRKMGGDDVRCRHGGQMVSREDSRTLAIMSLARKS